MISRCYKSRMSFILKIDLVLIYIFFIKMSIKMSIEIKYNLNKNIIKLNSFDQIINYDKVVEVN